MALVECRQPQKHMNPEKLLLMVMPDRKE